MSGDEQGQKYYTMVLMIKTKHVAVVDAFNHDSFP
jgi:hypothetical protein